MQKTLNPYTDLGDPEFHVPMGSSFTKFLLKQNKAENPR